MMEYDRRQEKLRKAEELIGEKALDEIIGEKIYMELQEIKKELLKKQN